MLPPKIPKIRNKKSQALELLSAFALLTMAIVINATIRKKMHGIKVVTPYCCKASMTPVIPNTEKTIPIIHKIAMIHVKKLAML